MQPSLSSLSTIPQGIHLNTSANHSAKSEPCRGAYNSQPTQGAGSTSSTQGIFPTFHISSSSSPSSPGLTHQQNMTSRCQQTQQQPPPLEQKGTPKTTKNGNSVLTTAQALYEAALARASARRSTTPGAHLESMLDNVVEEGELIPFKDVMLKPGVEHIQFEDSHYLGTVDSEGCMAGYGKATFASGDTYEGEWLHDRMHGRGSYTWADGDYYDGEYCDGFMNGHGEMHDETGVYVGEWVDDMRQGSGRMVYSGGNVYDGEWLGGMRHGHGKLTETNGFVYEGQFSRNEKAGKGIQKTADGGLYEGEFANGKPNGRGTYLWDDGAKYVGYFKDGLKHGEGCQWLPNGDWIAGHFVDDAHDQRQAVHKAVAGDFVADELPDGVETAMAPMHPRQLLHLTMAAQAAERKAMGTELANNTTGRPRSGRREDVSSDGASSQVTQKKLNDRIAQTANSNKKLSLSRAAIGSTSLASTASSSNVGGGSTFALTLRSTVLTDKDLENWTQLKIIGKGSFGAVYEALLTCGRTVCCKVIELGNIENRDELDRLKNEIALIKRLDHPNIVQYYGSLEDKVKNTINIFMEFVGGGSLNGFVKKFKRIPLETMRQWTFQMVCGVCYLHECGIVHRDLKGDNILVSIDGIVKLADFGCSKSIDDVCSATHGCATMVGTPYWMAPEVIKCEAGGYGAKSDIWSLGCTMVEMVTGKPPWPECNSMWAAVYKIANSTGLPTEIPEDLDPQLMDLLRRCFERNPKDRPTAAQMLEHPFLACVAESLSEVSY